VKDWENDLAVHARTIKKDGGFRGAQTALLRDDAAPEIRAKAVAEFSGESGSGWKGWGKSSGGSPSWSPAAASKRKSLGTLPADVRLERGRLAPYPGFDQWVLKRAQDIHRLARDRFVDNSKEIPVCLLTTSCLTGL